MPPVPVPSLPSVPRTDPVSSVSSTRSQPAEAQHSTMCSCDTSFIQFADAGCRMYIFRISKMHRSMHTGCCIFMIVYHESWVVPARLTVAVGAKICFIIDSYTSWGGQTVQESIILLRGKGWGVVWGYRFRLGPRHELGTSVGHFGSLLCRRGRHCCHPHPPH